MSQILPPLTPPETKQFKDGMDSKTSTVLEIRNGEYIRGQLDKGALGDTSKGIIHRVVNDFGNMHQLHLSMISKTLLLNI